MNKAEYNEKLEELHDEFIGDIEQSILSAISQLEDSIKDLEGVEDLSESDETQVNAAEDNLYGALLDLRKLAEKIY